MHRTATMPRQAELLQRLNYTIALEIVTDAVRLG